MTDGYDTIHVTMIAVIEHLRDIYSVWRAKLTLMAKSLLKYQKLAKNFKSNDTITNAKVITTTNVADVCSPKHATKLGYEIKRWSSGIEIKQVHLQKILKGQKQTPVKSCLICYDVYLVRYFLL